jgi:NRE family putative nickel resistance protein-like MFS transporter
VWQIYVLIFAINAVTAFFTPTFEATIPEIVGGEQYVKALSLSRVATDVEAVAAPALAGILVAFLGVRWVFWFDAFTYLISAMMVAVVAIPFTVSNKPPLSLKNFFNEITYGTRVLLGEPSLRQALTLSFAEATAGAAAIVATVVYVHDVLCRGNTTFAFIMAGLGLGSSLTAIFLSRVTGRYEKLADSKARLHGRRHIWSARALILGGLLLGLILLPGVLQPPLLIFGLLWVLNGTGQALIAIPSSTLLAEHTFEEERGRAYAAHFALTHLCWLVTYPAIGHASARWGSPATFTMAGLVCLVVTVIAGVLGQGTSTAHVHQKR